MVELIDQTYVLNFKKEFLGLGTCIPGVISFCTRSTFGSVCKDNDDLIEDEDEDDDNDVFSDDSHFCSLQLLKPGNRSEYLQCSLSLI